MTPGTRQSRQDALFHGRSNTVTPASSGGITVVVQKRASSSAQDSETVVIWSGDGAVVISDFAAYWRNRGKQGGDPFRGGIGTHARSLPPTNLDEELRTAVSVFAPAATMSSKFRARHVDTLIAGQLSFVIIAAPKSQPQEPQPSASQRRSAPPDAALLTTGDLDVAGLDRMLDHMESNAASVQNGSGR
jgi:hypothetical protein